MRERRSPARAALLSSFVLAASSAACEGARDLPLVPGLYGAPRVGGVDVRVVRAGTAASNALVRGLDEGGRVVSEERTDAEGRARVERGEHVEVVVGGVPASRWSMPPVDGLVIDATAPASAPSERSFTVPSGTRALLSRVRGLALLHDRIDLGSRTTRCEGTCSVAIDERDELVATVLDERDEAASFALGDGLGARFDAPIATTELVVPFPTPPTDLSAIIGIPGLVRDAGVGVLASSTTTSSSLSLSLPSLPDARYWFFARASREPASTDASYLFARGFGAEGPATWSSWLALPEATAASGVLTISTSSSEGTEVATIVFERPGAEDLVHHAWLTAPSTRLPIPEGATRALVRTIDLRATSLSEEVTFDALERDVARFAERSIDL